MPSPDKIREAYAANGQNARATARALGVSHTTVLNAVSRRKTAADIATATPIRPPVRQQGPYSWDLETIRTARDAQIRGEFKLAHRLAIAMRTDDAIFFARRARLAPIKSIATDYESPNDSVRAKTVLRAASEGLIVTRATLMGIAGTLADHGIAIGFNRREVSEDGTFETFYHEEWPIEHVRWVNSLGVLQTQTLDGQIMNIEHGDGVWTVYRGFAREPWTEEACLLAAAMIWPAHAEGIANWNATSASHGSANKLIGELPAGIALQDADGALTTAAQGFVDMLAAVGTGEAPAGIRPAGSKTDLLSNTSTAWQIFDTQTTSRERAAARVYCGTDAILGSNSNAPGVDISELFGVASTIIQGDIEVIETCFYAGVSVPWTAVNYGDSRNAPALLFRMPDPDAEQASTQAAAKHERLMAAIASEKSAGCVVDQNRVDTLARVIGVSPAPQLKTIAEPAPLPPPAPPVNT